MKNFKLVVIAAASIVFVGCQQTSQQTAEPIAPVSAPVVETGTCDFGAKASQRGIVTTRNDCNLRGGAFTPSNTGYAAPVAPAAAPALVDSSNAAVQTI